MEWGQKNETRKVSNLKKFIERFFSPFQMWEDGGKITSNNGKMVHSLSLAHHVSDILVYVYYYHDASCSIVLHHYHYTKALIGRRVRDMYSREMSSQQS